MTSRVTPPVLRLHDVWKSYAGRAEPAVAELDFEIVEGEIFTLLGPSGCGKTTTLRLIAGFERADQGQVFLRGSITANSRHWTPPEKRGVGMVFQDYALFPHLSVLENVAFGLRDLDGEARQRRCDEILGLVGLSSHARHYPHQLSGGEQQRVALARALAPRPVLVLLDEPFGSLDADLRRQVRQEVRTILRGLGSTAILVTHDRQEALTLSDRGAVLQAGRIQQIGSPEQIYHHPATRFVASFVGPAHFVPGQVRAGQVVTELGTFPYDDEVDQAPAQVDVLIRPEEIEIVAVPRGRASVTGREFHGPDVSYEVQLDSGLQVICRPAGPPLHPVGARVAVRAVPKRVVLFPADTSPQSSVLSPEPPSGERSRPWTPDPGPGTQDS